MCIPLQSRNAWQWRNSRNFAKNKQLQPQRPNRIRGSLQKSLHQSSSTEQKTCKLLKKLVDVTGIEPVTPCLQSRTIASNSSVRFL